MDRELQITVLSSDQATLDALAQQPLALDGPRTVAFEEPTHVPGAMGGWYELAATLGVLALPAGVLASCLANWITNALAQTEESPRPNVRAKLVFQYGEQLTEVELAAEDPDVLSAAIKSALDHVHPK